MFNRWFNTTNFVLRTMFGFNVNFVDWTDFIINCLELPYPNIEDLLYLKNQYLELEKKRQKNPNKNYTEGDYCELTTFTCNLFYNFQAP